MAGDGDMFAQRKAWGFNRLCAGASGAAPTERLAEIEIQNVRNMLGNGYAVPSLKPSIQNAFRVLDGLRNEHTAEWKAFSGRAALSRYLLAA
jgi:hypothetical protein